MKNDTIMARATPAGTGSVAIARVSGPRALEIAESLFCSHSGENVRDLPPRTLVLGALFDSPAKAPGDATNGGKENRVPRRPIDECLLAVWRAPHSYTGEDVAEWHLHGGARVVEMALEAIGRAGARLAEPGEFTRRAFLNGRIDLAQAEAVADLVAAQTERAARCALRQLAGGLSGRVTAIRDPLLALTAETEAAIDFPEEDIPDSDRARQAAALERAMREIDSLLRDARRGRPLREGARVAIAGRPNTGKSSVFNAILGRERAIVAPHEGTTRDTIEGEVDLDGIPTILVDMAGLRDRPEEIEAMGIARAHEEIAAADLVIFLLDGSRPLGGSDDEAFARVREKPHVIAVNKADLPPAYAMRDAETRFASEHRRGVAHLSARTREGMDSLERLMTSVLRGETPGMAGSGEYGGSAKETSTTPVGFAEFPGAENAETPLLANSRHIHLLEEAQEQLRRASEGLAGRLSPEFIAVDLQGALRSLGSILGRGDLSEDLLDSIFSRFCIGK